MKRRKHRKLTVTKGKKITCTICFDTFMSKLHFKQHILNSENCKLLHPLYCKTCMFLGHNEASLLHHLEVNECCKHFYEEKRVASGLLRTMPSECITKNKSIPHTTSYVFNRYSTDGISDKVQLNLKDDTIEKKSKSKKFHR